MSGFFARRSRDAQTVADLTADTFVEAMRSFGESPPRRGKERAWLYGIARNVYARHCQQAAQRKDAATRHANRRTINDDETEQINERVDAEAPGRQLLSRLAGMSAVEREAIELVDLTGLAPKEAASVLCVLPGVLRIRLFRAASPPQKGAPQP